MIKVCFSFISHFFYMDLGLKHEMCCLKYEVCCWITNYVFCSWFEVWNVLFEIWSIGLMKCLYAVLRLKLFSAIAIGCCFWFCYENLQGTLAIECINVPWVGKKPMSLDKFLSTYTSEDNASFSVILRENELKKRLKHEWLFNEEEQRDKVC